MGSLTRNRSPPRLTPYTSHLVAISGEYDPSRHIGSEIFAPSLARRTYGSRSCAAQLNAAGRADAGELPAPPQAASARLEADEEDARAAEPTYRHRTRTGGGRQAAC